MWTRIKGLDTGCRVLKEQIFIVFDQQWFDGVIAASDRALVYDRLFSALIAHGWVIVT